MKKMLSLLAVIALLLPALALAEEPVIDLSRGPDGADRDWLIMYLEEEPNGSSHTGPLTDLPTLWAAERYPDQMTLVLLGDDAALIYNRHADKLYVFVRRKDGVAQEYHGVATQRGVTLADGIAENIVPGYRGVYELYGDDRNGYFMNFTNDDTGAEAWGEVTVYGEDVFEWNCFFGAPLDAAQPSSGFLAVDMAMFSRDEE